MTKSSPESLKSAKDALRRLKTLPKSVPNLPTAPPSSPDTLNSAQDALRSFKTLAKSSPNLPTASPNRPRPSQNLLQTLPKPSQDPPQSDQKSTFSPNSFLERLSTPYVPSRGCPKPPKTSPKTSQHGVKIDKNSMSKNKTLSNAILDGFGTILDLVLEAFFCIFLVPS